MVAPTFPHAGYWQACTRFPFLALLMRWVVGVKVTGTVASAGEDVRMLFFRPAMLDLEARC